VKKIINRKLDFSIRSIYYISDQQGSKTVTIILSNLLVNTVTFLALYEYIISGSNPDVVSLQNILFATFLALAHCFLCSYHNTRLNGTLSLSQLDSQETK